MGGANADQARARDITRQQADAIGYAARSSLLGGGIAVTTVHPSLAEARLVLFAPTPATASSAPAPPSPPSPVGSLGARAIAKPAP